MTVDVGDEEHQHQWYNGNDEENLFGFRYLHQLSIIGFWNLDWVFFEYLPYFLYFPMYNIILDYLQPIKHVFGGQIYVIVVQGGISWQPFWRPQKISQSFRKARICQILRQKCRICKITKTLYLQIFASKMSPFQIPKTRIYPMFLLKIELGIGYPSDTAPRGLGWLPGARRAPRSLGWLPN